MNGYDLLRKLYRCLGEESTSAFLASDFSYDLLYDAVCTFLSRTGAYTSSQTITSVDGTRTYNLDPEFNGLYMQSPNDNRFFITYTTSAGDKSNIYYKDYESLYYNDNDYEVDIPSNFAIIDASVISNITGSATATGSLSATGSGTSVLTDSAADFSTVSEGDEIINYTDDSHGIVTAVSTTLTVAMLGGTNNFFTSADVYCIIPQQRMAVYLDPEPDVSGDTFVVPYLAKPIKVYSAYQTYPILDIYSQPIVEYAAFMYKYKDREPVFGDKWYQHFDVVCREASNSYRRINNKTTFKVNMKKTGYKSGSHR